MADIKGMNPEQINKMLADFGVNQNGKANVENLVNSIFDHYGADDPALKGEMKDLFERFALKDGNAELSAEEYEAAMNSDNAKTIITKISENVMAPYNNARPVAGLPYSSSGIDADVYRDAVAKERGSKFIDRVYDPVQKSLDDALEYAINHNGSTDDFHFIDNPYIKFIGIRPIPYSFDSRDDITTEVNGQPETIINVDHMGLVFICEYEGERIKINSTSTTTNLEPFRKRGDLKFSFKKEQ